MNKDAARSMIRSFKMIWSGIFHPQLKAALQTTFMTSIQILSLWLQKEKPVFCPVETKRCSSGSVHSSSFKIGFQHKRTVPILLCLNKAMLSKSNRKRNDCVSNCSYLTGSSNYI